MIREFEEVICVAKHLETDKVKKEEFEMFCLIYVRSKGEFHDRLGMNVK